MKQKTAKTVEDVLQWVETNEHHKGEWFDNVLNTRSHLVLSGHQSKLRIPLEIQVKTRNLIEPAKSRFDNRMYRATKSGKDRLRRYGKKPVDGAA